MSLSAISGVSHVEGINWPGSIHPVPKEPNVGQRGWAGNSTPRTAADTYTPGVPAGSGQLPSYAASPAALPVVSAAGSLQNAALLNGISPSLLNGLSSSSLQTQDGTTAPIGSLLSGLSAAISTAAQDGAGDANWVDDLVSFASGRGGGAGYASSPGSASGGPVAGGALASDLSTIEGVVKQLSAQVSGALVSQGASASQVSAAVQALTTSLTLNSLGAVAQQIAAQAGGPNTFTVASSVVTISTNGSSANVSEAGETESFSGSNGSLALTATSGSASLTGTGGAAGDGAGSVSNLTAQGFGYTFSITENGPHGSSFAGTSEASATAEAASSNGSGGSVNASAALEESTTVYESESASGTGSGSHALVLLSDWEASLESTANKQAEDTNSVADAQSSQASAPAASSAPAPTLSIADSLNAAAHALFKQALALLHGMIGWGDGNLASNAGRGSRVDVYA